MPLPFILYQTVQLPRLFGSTAQEPAMLVSLAFSNLLYWMALAALIVLLAGPGDPQPNSYTLES
jgi:hypothetical protein